tara:strand:- start:89099 stop:89353 length:255 start_codon:yes stop_codon:yes gene_type:complete
LKNVLRWYVCLASPGTVQLHCPQPLHRPEYSVQRSLRSVLYSRNRPGLPAMLCHRDPTILYKQRSQYLYPAQHLRSQLFGLISD